MTKIFTIQITPIRKPYMREKKVMQQTVCKYRNGSSGYEYSPYAYGKQHCGYVYKYKDTDACIAERGEYMPAFLDMVDRVHAKARSRFFKFYADYNQDDEIIRVWAPYPTLAPNALKTVYSQRKHQHDDHMLFLQRIKSKMRIQYNTLMSVLQQGQWDLANDSLYKLNNYLYELQSMCRPEHHEVVFKGKVNPLTANRK